MNAIAVISPARLQVKNEKVYFEPSNLVFEREQSEQDAAQASDKINEVSGDRFNNLYGPRHDEFDWDLTTVSHIIY